MGSLAFVVVIVVAGQVAYHLVARGSTKTPAFLLAAIAYGVGFALSATLAILHGEARPSEIHAQTLTRGLALGLAVSAVELGYLYSYRRGLPVTTGALTVLTLTTLVLMPIGALVIGDRVSVRSVAGVTLAIFGVWLIQSR